MMAQAFMASFKFDKAISFIWLNFNPLPRLVLLLFLLSLANKMLLTNRFYKFILPSKI